MSFDQLLLDIRRSIRHVDGWLTDREVQFLALAAAMPSTEGRVVEIGSYRGRSTIVLATASPDSQSNPIVAIDPLPDEPPMAYDARGRKSARALFDRNLQSAGVEQKVEFHQGYSYEVAQSWQQPIRLLWIDGDHSYASTKQDFDLFSPYLADGAIVAMHDVLSRYDGCIQVFTQEVLGSPNFSSAGVCGSIGWARHEKGGSIAAETRRRKEKLRRKLQPLIAYHRQDIAPRGMRKLHYKWLRHRVPHRKLPLAQWQRDVA